MLAVLLLPLAVSALDLPHYDLDSLAYMSTDIIVATLSVSSRQRFTATVSDTLYGTLKSGDKLETLSPFLELFQPMKDGQRVILFLDRRPRPPDFFHPEASRSPFAVLPSGVYLIDVYEHVHQYYQINNPGPYLAEGYHLFIELSIPTKEQDLALPTLEDVTTRIAMSLKLVKPLRPLLEKAATRQDAPALMNLLDTRSKNRKSCNPDAILDRLNDQLRSLEDPEISLKSFALAPDWRSPIAFVNHNGNRDKDYTAARVKYLLQTLSDKKKSVSLRVAALEILLNVSKFHGGPHAGPSQALPIDNEWLADSASEIQSTAKTIFDDESEDGHLRSLCLQFIPLDQPLMVAHAKQIYSKTRSEELRFAIEDLFLKLGDAFYEDLKPPGGPIASVVLIAPERGCVKATGDNIAFIETYRERNDFDQLGGVGHQRFVMTNLRTNQRFTPKFNTLSEWRSARNSEMAFEFSQLLDIPVGNYTIAPEFSRNDQVFSTGHTLAVTIRDTPTGKRLSLK